MIFRNNHIGAFGSYDGVDNLSVLNTAAQSIYAPSSGTGEIFDDFGDAVNGNTNAGTDPLFTSLVLGSEYDLRPAAGSPLLTGATTTAAEAGASDFIEDSGFRGAIPADANWAAECGWTAVSQIVTMPSGVADSEIEVLGVSQSGTTFTLTFVSEVGKSYRITSSPDLNTAFVPVAAQSGISGNGSNIEVTFTLPVVAADHYFFRVEAE